MTEFLEKTWSVWWIVAALAFLRWFHVVSAHGRDEPEPEDAHFEHDDLRGGSSCPLNSLPVTEVKLV